MSERLLSKRDFLKLAAMAAGSAVLTACAPKLADAIGLIPDAHTLPATLTQTTPTETLTPSITPDVWKLSLSQRVELMREPEFFTKLQGNNTKKIITLQFDDSEYVRMKRNDFDKINNCGEASLATGVKLWKFLNSGIVPDVTIADIHTLDGMAFTDVKGYSSKYVDWDDSMPIYGLPSAFNILVPEMISKTEFITPNYGVRYWRILPQRDWPEALSKAQAVCEGGGYILLGGFKGGGHIVLATDVKGDGTATIVDSFTGTAQKLSIKNYFDLVVDPDAKYQGEQPGLRDVIGITPKLSSSG